MSACQIYYKNRIPNDQQHLIKKVTEIELFEAFEKSFPLLDDKKNNFEKVVNMGKNFYLGFDGFFYKLDLGEVL